MTSINELFVLRGFHPPVNLADKQDINVKIINAIESEESVANQRSPITNEMFAQMGANAANSARDSLDRVMFDFFCLVRICGFRVAEYAQTSQTKVDYHEYPSGKRVIKAFLSTDWVFRDKNNRTVKPGNFFDPTLVKRLVITFRIQKNKRNGQKITVVADSEHPDICPVRAALRIIERATRINQSGPYEPLAVYVSTSGKKKYLTAAKIASTLQSVAAFTHPDLTADEIKRFSSHSGRVWAVVLLDQAGKSPDFIKSRLRWLGDSYRSYLRDTEKIQNQHLAALEADSDNVALLFLGHNTNILPDDVPIDPDMGQYVDGDELET